MNMGAMTAASHPWRATINPNTQPVHDVSAKRHIKARIPTGLESPVSRQSMDTHRYAATTAKKPI